MRFDDLVFGTFLSVVSAVLTAVAGLVVTIWSSRLERKRRTAEGKIEEVAANLRSGQAADIASIEAAIERISTQRDKSELANIAQSLRDIVPTIVSRSDESSAVENLVSGYHEQALSQARAQFWFSIAAAVVGFTLIIYSALGVGSDGTTTLFRFLPGVVMDAVAFLFFRQASETRQRATELYDRLRRDKLASDSIALVASIEDVRVRSAVKAQLALHMAGLEPSPINLTSFLSSETSEDRDSHQDDGLERK